MENKIIENEIKARIDMNQNIPLKRFLREKLVRIFTYEWEDNTISIGVAKNKIDAAAMLDEIGNADPKRVKFQVIDGFFITAKRVKDRELNSGYSYKFTEGESESIMGILLDWADKKGINYDTIKS